MDDPAGDEEEAVAFRELGQTVTDIRERRCMTREQLAQKCEMTVLELERIEKGEVHELWGNLDIIAKGLEMRLYELFREYEEGRLGPGGET